MPQSFCQLYAHLVFSTKNRQGWLDDAVRPSVHACLAAILHRLGASDVLVGGAVDHVHILSALPKTVAATTVVQRVKQDSSKQIKTFGRAYGDFCWQRGYGLFAVSPTAIRAVRSYIGKQEEHHRTVSFQEEFLAILRKAGATWDERYVWD